MSDRPRYPMIIDWSDEDDAYLVIVPDLPGARTHGPDYAEAARKGQEVIEGWLAIWRADGRPLPEARHAGLGARLDPTRRWDVETAPEAERDAATR